MEKAENGNKHWLMLHRAGSAQCDQTSLKYWGHRGTADTLFQVEDAARWLQIKLFAFPTPKGRVLDVCNQVAQRYRLEGLVLKQSYPTCWSQLLGKLLQALVISFLLYHLGLIYYPLWEVLQKNSGVPEDTPQCNPENIRSQDFQTSGYS